MNYTGRWVALLFLIGSVALRHISYLMFDPEGSYTFFFSHGTIAYDFIYIPLAVPLLWRLGKQYDKARFLSEKDPLTGVYNRRYVAERFRKMPGNRFYVAIVDVNDFKAINDTYGHGVGDQALRQIANELMLRAGHKTDIVARTGGDEFVVISELSHFSDGPIPLVVEGNVPVSVSVGTAQYPLDADTLEELMEVADRNMYRMKQGASAPQIMRPAAGHPS